MPHFVTSAQGKAHVTSANAAHLTAGLLGNGCYVLPIGQKLACTMTDSNTLRVLFGVASVCGRQWEIEGDYEEVNIDNGVPGYNRTDLLVCRIETAPQETIALKVYKGEETTGTPVTPGHVEGDLNDGDTVCEMPICSVRINGINPQAPEMLVNESPTIVSVDANLAELLKAFQDYKSQCPFKVGDLLVTTRIADPSKEWPGTKWEQIKDKFLRAADNLSTGGADLLTLTLDNMPPHAHVLSGAGAKASSAGAHWHHLGTGANTYLAEYKVAGVSSTSSGNWWGVFDSFSETEARPSSSIRTVRTKDSDGAHEHTLSGSTATVGGGKAFDNRPVFQNVFVWKRTA